MFEKKQTGSDAPREIATPDEEKEAKEERKRGGAHKRKRGGHIPGHKSEDRPDRRARGGRTGSDMHPETSSGNMSEMDYTKGKRTNKDEEGAGKGGDKNAKGFG